MKTLIAHLELSQNLQGRVRDRCPNVVWTVDDHIIATIRTDVEFPTVPLGTESVHRIEIRDDALSRVMDEVAWLKECHRVLAVGGEICFTLPAAGPLGWLDAMNMYRYAVDIGKRGDQPDAALPTGWNRHYSQDDVVLMLGDTGFDRPELRSANYALSELGLFATLFWRNWLGGNRNAELEHFPRYGKRAVGEHRFPLATTWTIEARKHN